jgi:hypothetical protein
VNVSLEHIFRWFLLLLAGIVSDGGGGDTGTVILPSAAARTLDQATGDRGSWTVDDPAYGIEIALPSEFSGATAALFSTSNGGNTGVLLVQDGALFLGKQMITTLVNSGVQELRLTVMAAEQGLVLDLLIQLGETVVIEAR